MQALFCCHGDAQVLGDKMQQGSMSLLANWTVLKWKMLLTETFYVIKSGWVPCCHKALPLSSEIHAFFLKKVSTWQTSYCLNRIWIHYINGAVNSQSKAGAHPSFINQLGNKQVHISVVTKSIKGLCLLSVCWCVPQRYYFLQRMHGVISPC